MTVHELIAIKDQLNYNLDESSAKLNALCAEHKNEMGLVSDEFRRTETYKSARAQFDHDWNAMRSFNEAHSKNKELSNALHSRWMARRQPR